MTAKGPSAAVGKVSPDCQELGGPTVIGNGRARNIQGSLPA